MNKLLVLFWMVLFSCQTPVQSDYDRLQKFCDEHSNGVVLSNFQSVIIIAAQGSCLNCQKIFSQKMSDRLEDEQVLFILSEDGTKVDISEYIESKKDNVIWDINGEFQKLGLVNSSAIILLKKNKIVNITKVSPDNIENF